MSEEDNITRVQGIVVDLVPITDDDEWLIGQIFVSSSFHYNSLLSSGCVYIGESTFVFNKNDYPELWEIYKDDPNLDTGRVPKMTNLTKQDKFFVKVTNNTSIIEDGE